MRLYRAQTETDERLEASTYLEPVTYLPILGHDAKQRFLYGLASHIITLKVAV